MPRREHKHMFWLDLETTGSDLDGHHIIEVGAAITDMSLNVLDGRSYVLNPGELPEMKPVVLAMHQKNGLFADMGKRHMVTPLSIVDNELSEWIRDYNGSDHILFAGSGVMHFDRKFIKRDLPLTDARLTHYAIDVGVIRRTFEMFLRSDSGWPEDTKTHRAFDDVIFHIEEFKFALDKMEGIL